MTPYPRGVGMLARTFRRHSFVPLRYFLGRCFPPNIFFGSINRRPTCPASPPPHRPRPCDLVACLLATVLDGDLADLRQAEQVNQPRTQAASRPRVAVCMNGMPFMSIPTTRTGNLVGIRSSRRLAMGLRIDLC